MTLRDGSCTSLWQETTHAYAPSASPASRDFDVIIAGAGITGLTLAVLLQQAGKKCAVLEAQTIGFGTTGGTTAHLNTLLDTTYPALIRDFGVDTAQLVADAARTAIDLVKENISRFKIECGFEEVPAYLYAQTAQQEKELLQIHDDCLRMGVEVEYAAEIPIPLPFKRAIKIARQGKFHPLRYLNGIAQVFEDSGGVIIENCRVQHSEAQSDHYGKRVVQTSLGDFQSDTLVYATHIPIGVNLLHLRCPAYRSYAMAVRLEDGDYPKGLAYDMYEPYHYYRTQEIEGRRFLIAGGEDHRTGEESDTNGRFLKLESHIRAHFQVAYVVSQWSSQYYESVDGLPYIGHLPGNQENVFVATGYGGNGMTYSHVAALLLKSMILGEKNPYEDVFRPARLKPVAGAAEFVKHNADVVKQFFGKWFGHEKLQEIAMLAPGEGKVVKYENETLALYKDEQGEIHAVNPTCTHMHCSVRWNAAETSWDCPCHGARYNCDGEVLNGPAARDLEHIEVRALAEKED